MTPLDEFQAVDFWEVEVIEIFEIKDVVFTDLRRGGETLTHGSQRHHWGDIGAVILVNLFGFADLGEAVDSRRSRPLETIETSFLLVDSPGRHDLPHDG